MSGPDVLNMARNGGTDAGRRFRLPPALRVPAVLLAVAVMAVLPRIMNLYWIDVFVRIGLGLMLSLSLNVILGQTGIFNMGHAAFYAVGAYVTAILNTRFGVPVLWLLPAAGAAARELGRDVGRAL